MSMRVLCAGVVCTTLLLTMPGHSLAKKPADLPVQLDGKCKNDAGVSVQVPVLGPVPIALDFGFPIVPGAKAEAFGFWTGLFGDDPSPAEEAAGCLTLDAFCPALWSALGQAFAGGQCPECPQSNPTQRIDSIPLFLPLGPNVRIGVDINVAPRVAKPQRGFAVELRARFTAKPQGDAACDPHWLAQARHLFLIAEQCQKSGDLDMARNCYQEVQLLAPQSSYAKKAAEQLQELTCDEPSGYEKPPSAYVFPAVVPFDGGWYTFSGTRFGPATATQSPGDWWQERFLKAAREIHEERLRNDSLHVPRFTCPAPQSNETPAATSAWGLGDLQWHRMDAQLRLMQRALEARNQPNCPYFHQQPESRVVPESRLYERTPVQLLEELQVKRAESARKMYHKGEHARQAGEMAKALHYFKAAHAMCPTCAFGERALEHIFAIENGLLPRERGIGEEAEPPAAAAPSTHFPDWPVQTPPAEKKQSADEHEVPPAPLKKDSRSRVLEGTVPLEIFLDDMVLPTRPFHATPSVMDVWTSSDTPHTFRGAGSSDWVSFDIEGWRRRQQQFGAVSAWTVRLVEVGSSATAWNIIDEPGVYVELVGMRRPNRCIPAHTRWDPNATSKLMDLILGDPARGFVDHDGPLTALPHDSSDMPVRNAESARSKSFDWLHYKHLSFRFGVVKPALEAEQLEEFERPHFDGPFLPGRALASAAIDYYPPSNIFGDERCPPNVVEENNGTKRGPTVPEGIDTDLREIARRHLQMCGSSISYEKAEYFARSEVAFAQALREDWDSMSTPPLSSRLCAAARRLLDSLDIDIASDSEQGVRIAVNLGGQHYLFHYSFGAWMIFVSP